MSDYRSQEAGSTNTRGFTLVARADGSPIVAGTVNWYLKNLSGANAGKWWRDSDQTWQVAETANPMSHVSDGHWTRDLAASPWTSGDVSLEYAKESANLHIPISRNLKVEYTPSANSSRRVDIGSILGTALTETAGQIAAAFKKFFNVATPASTMDALTLVATATNLTNAPTAGDFTATMKASITTATPTAAAIAAAVLAASVESGVSVKQILEAIGAAMAGDYDDATKTFGAVGNPGTARVTTALAGFNRTNTLNL